MLDNKSIFTRLAIASHPKLSNGKQVAEEIVDFLKEYDVEIFYTTLDDEELASRIQSDQVDLLIALGGDGSMLRAGHICGPLGVPIMGINLGHFGFLMEIRQNQWSEFLPRLFQEDYWLERRMMLCAKHIRDNHDLSQWEVLNEAVIGRGKNIRPVHISTYVDNRFLTTYVADAVIAATATGSTAYALAAGGPILPPELRNILLVPVAPHLSIDRAIILAEGSTVSIRVQFSHDALLSIDGQNSIHLEDDDRIDVHASENDALFIRFQDPGYFYRTLTPHMNQNPSIGMQR
jgi:NAD+ kinase